MNLVSYVQRTRITFLLTALMKLLTSALDLATLAGFSAPLVSFSVYTASVTLARSMLLDFPAVNRPIIPVEKD